MPVDATFSAPGRFWKGNLHTHSTRDHHRAILRRTSSGTEMVEKLAHNLADM
jgi:hypothetical protein